ncbi:MAG TPA: hypothetical protein VMF89_27300, partial [Polyangiales bacterium]|nr:hypothetical protein [Polyangiales bacterium]
MLDSALHNAAKLICTARGKTGVGGIGKQQLEVPIELSHRVTQAIDRRAREQVASETFERGSQQRMDQRECACFAVGWIGAAHDGDHRQKLGCIITQPANVDGLPGEDAHLPAALLVGTSRVQGIVDQIDEIGTGGRIVGPAQLPLGIEDRNGLAAREEGSDELRIRLERPPGI